MKVRGNGDNKDNKREKERERIKEEMVRGVEERVEKTWFHLANGGNLAKVLLFLPTKRKEIRKMEERKEKKKTKEKNREERRI